MRQTPGSQEKAVSPIAITFAVSAATVVLLGSAALVVYTPASQRLLLQFNPTPGVSVTERLSATQTILRFFADGDISRLAGYTPEELAHLQEVAVVARALAGIWLAAMLGAVVTGGLMVQHAGRTVMRVHLCRTLKATAFGCAVFLVAGSLAFAPLFSWLHRFTFVAAPWEFDPATSRLVNEFPPEYFQVKLVAVLLAAIVTSLGLWAVFRRRST